MIYVCVTFKVYVRGFDLDFAGITLTTEVELNHWNTQELGVATDISWHWHLGILVCVSIGERLKGLGWVTDSGNGNVFDYKVGIFKVRLRMLRAEEELKVNVFTTWNSTLGWMNSIMSEFVFKSNFLLIFLFIDTPMIWYRDW